MAKVILMALGLLLVGATTDTKITPMAAYAILKEQDGHQTMRAVIVQVDATHAVVGTQNDTEALTINENGTQDTSPLETIAIQNLYKLGSSAPLKRGIVIICSQPDPST